MSNTVGILDPDTRVVVGGWGGNRLPPGHPGRSAGPLYERVRELSPDPVRRDGMGREHARRAIAVAGDAGELTLQEQVTLHALMNFSNETLEVVWPSQARLGRAIGRSSRTVGRHIASLVRKGWVSRKHRFIYANGMPRAITNLYRVDVPDRWLGPIRAAARGARDRTNGAKSAPTPIAPQNTPGWKQGRAAAAHAADAAVAAATEQRRQAKARWEAEAGQYQRPSAEAVAINVAEARRQLSTSRDRSPPSGSAA